MKETAISTLADISMMMWQECHRRGISASVRVSKHTRASRYVTINKCVVVRLSDHSSDDSDIDFQLIVRNSDDFKLKRREASALLQHVLGEQKAAAA